jgi:hypothetical protein
MLFVPSRATLNVLLLHRTPYIQGVLKMAHYIYVTRIYVEYQTKNSNSNLVLDKYFLNY